MKLGKFYGIGIGPGDPELLTLKGQAFLKKSDILFVPRSRAKEGSHALSIIKRILPKKLKIRELVFPMVKDDGVLKKYWKLNAREIANEIKKGKDCAFITIGDPFIYSTYIYLLNSLKKILPRLEHETVPGISAFQAAASRASIPLAEKDERIAIIPVPDKVESLKTTLKNFDTIILYKVASKLERLIKLLRRMKLHKKAVFASRVGLKDEYIERNLSKLGGGGLGYMSIIIVRKNAK